MSRRPNRKSFKVNERTEVCSNHFESPTSEKIILNKKFKKLKTALFYLFFAHKNIT